MSYCRFENTDDALMDCENAIESLLSGDEDEGKLSRSELQAAKDLVARCQNIVSLIQEHAGIAQDEALDFDIGAAFEALHNEAVEAEEEE